ncbi:hypothetical protein ASPWEDRAFT_39069 [Aspergillus wentii DTO 134E9]|uniref:Uncharacterized protein n=1 Tax=Aspergillus wentii DTO 134E9 TaxID=1073089 RepID=A0A1L9RR81_ASPWE|nr:uncharacterized protein ASPWEDRAFT_39069 [Aspergillus wentii DTO 134E9]OJJ37383.1 hypothetical protein ASPWEDRAFT_39069 [Aspergillus wentii DTO 134E9]
MNQIIAKRDRLAGSPPPFLCLLSLHPILLSSPSIVSASSLDAHSGPTWPIHVFLSSLPQFLVFSFWLRDYWFFVSEAESSSTPIDRPLGFSLLLFDLFSRHIDFPGPYRLVLGLSAHRDFTVSVVLVLPSEARQSDALRP